VSFFVAMIFTQLGDCFDVKMCIAYKNRAAHWILGGAPVIWLIGSLALVKRWNK
jgi:hypothetical protein